VEQVELIKDDDLAGTLHRRHRCGVDDLVGLGAQDRSALAFDLGGVGVLSAQGQRAVPAGPAPTVRTEQRSGERTCGAALAGTRRAEEEVGVHRR